MKILKGKKGDVCPISKQMLKTYKHSSVNYLISPCLHCPHQKISWISKEGFVTVRCCVDEVKKAWICPCHSDPCDEDGCNGTIEDYRAGGNSCRLAVQIWRREFGRD